MMIARLLAGCAALTYGAVAHAAVVTHDLSFDAKDFTYIVGDKSVAPFDPVSGFATITLDTSKDYVAQTSGFTFNSNTPYSATFSYNSATDRLILGAGSRLTGCSLGYGSFCAYFDGFSKQAYNLNYLERTTSGAIYFATFTSVSDAVAGVPEPATWAMMIAGFGLIGVAMRRRSVTTGLTAVTA